ncbi:2-dehydro-3-deoxygluconokinase [Thermoanaerobacterium thermosaccharolyticum]|uniref:sugar kinase n=1 Tax=Thermoanaerobacterium thermosaccharolyticum TaxID=1517 RepID=UPI000C07C6FD|nr:sugar kinase [Thermoanaerobacterium thermosaccharolyticum]PHO07249.1 2-dehydro-3-deoxygluconokinase [Thermoanaerobacterium thermosaccharolyticum]
MAEVLLVGEPMALFIAEEEGTLDRVNKFTKALAGAEANVAIGLSRLGHTVKYITRLGNDPFGKYIYEKLLEEEIDVSSIKFTDKYPTGFMLKSKTSKGDPDIFYFRKGSAASHVTPDDIDCELGEFKHIHITGITAALSNDTLDTLYRMIQIGKENGIRISFDPNIRKSLWKSEDEMVSTLNDIASRCNIVMPGIKEGFILTGSEEVDAIADFYLEKGAEAVIIKIGDKGAYVKTKDESFIVSGYKVEKVVDTVGAGDGFATGVISGLLEGLTLKDAVKRGNAIGAIIIMSPGDNDGLPDRETLDKFMKEN